MNKLSDYIPLLIIVGSIIYSIVKGGSKKAREEAAKTTLPGKKTQPPFPSERTVSPKNVVRKEKKVQPVPVVNPVKNELRKEHTKITVETHFSEEPEYTVPALNVEDREEIRRAFIYSEILTRKEY